MDNRTAEILNRFSESWVDTERFYNSLLAHNRSGFEFLNPILDLLAEMRKAGEDKFFRIGTSMHTLIISRSVNHGLRIDQKYIRIEAYSKTRFNVVLRDGEKTYREYMLDSLEDIRLKNLLQTLKDTLVD